MDDGGVVGPPALLQQVWDLLLSKGPPRGLHLNPDKCEWSWLDSSDDGVDPPCPLLSNGHHSGVPVVPVDSICMLGVPLGSPASCAAYVKDKLFQRLIPTIERLSDFDDCQSALFLRTSFGSVMATHFMRTTPLECWTQEASEFDRLI